MSISSKLLLLHSLLLFIVIVAPARLDARKAKGRIARCSSQEACTKLAMALEKDNRHRAAFDAYARGCAKGSIKCCVAAIRLMELGMGRWPDPKTLAGLYKRKCKLDKSLCSGEQGGALEVIRQMARCKQRHGPSCLALGLRYRDGRGGPADLDLALRHLTVACRAGLEDACAEVRALKLALGCDTVKRCKAGAEASKKQGTLSLHLGQLHRACQMGDGPSCVKVGHSLIHRHPPWGYADLGRAMASYALGCVQDHGDACRYQAYCLERLAGGAHTAASLKLHGQACLLGDALSCGELLEAIEKQPALKPDARQMMSYLEADCSLLIKSPGRNGSPRDLRNRKSCGKLGKMLMKQGGRAGEDHDDALLARVCLLGVVEACAQTPVPCHTADKCYTAAKAYDEGNPPMVKHNATAARLYRLACELKHSAACASYGLRLYTGGGGVVQDKARAKPYFLSACDAGVGAGCAGVANYYPKETVKGHYYRKLCCKINDSLLAKVCCLEESVAKLDEAIKEANTQRARLDRERQQRQQAAKKGDAVPGMERVPAELLRQYQNLRQRLSTLDDLLEQTKPRYGRQRIRRANRKLGESFYHKSCYGSGCYKVVYATERVLVGGDYFAHQEHRREYKSVLRHIKFVESKIRRAMDGK